jgi:hypothetical protein
MAFVDLAKSNAGTRQKTRSYAFTLWLTGWPSKLAPVPQRTLLLAIIIVALYALSQFGMLSELIEWAHNEINIPFLSTITQIIGVGTFLWFVLAWTLGIDLNSRLRRMEEAIKALWHPCCEVLRENNVVDSRPVPYLVKAGLRKKQSINGLQKAGIPSISKVDRRAHKEDTLKTKTARARQRASEIGRQDETAARIALDDRSGDWWAEEVSQGRLLVNAEAAQREEEYRRAMESYDSTVLTTFIRRHPGGYEADRVGVRLRHLGLLTTPVPAFERAAQRFTCRHLDPEAIYEVTDIGDDPPLSFDGKLGPLVARPRFRVEWLRRIILSPVYSLAALSAVVEHTRRRNASGCFGKFNGDPPLFFNGDAGPLPVRIELPVKWRRGLMLMGILGATVLGGTELSLLSSNSQLGTRIPSSTIVTPLSSSMN